MRQRINLTEIYRRALQQARAETDEAGELNALPADCPFALDDVLRANLDELVATLKSAA